MRVSKKERKKERKTNTVQIDLGKKKYRVVS